MFERDDLQQFSFENTAVRGALVRLDASYRAVLEKYSYPPVLQELLGEAMAAAALLAGSLKFEGSLTLQIQDAGDVSLFVAQCTHHHQLRAMARFNPDAQLSKPFLFEKGQLAISLDNEQTGARYQGIVPVAQQTLAQSIDTYFTQSEQVPTRIWLAADGQMAAGLFLQALPVDEFKRQQAVLEWEHLEYLTQTITEAELLNLSFTDILYRLYHAEPVRLHEPTPVSFRCTCSRERIEQTLRALGHEEVESILQEQGSVSVDCDFCRHHYHFDAVDAAQLFVDPSTIYVPGEKKT